MVCAEARARPAIAAVNVKVAAGGAYIKVLLDCGTRHRGKNEK
jgi:hypothetical protein